MQTPLDGLYIGLISGTSIDGVDAGLFNIRPRQIELVENTYQPFPVDVKEKILTLSQPGPNEIDEMGALDVQLGNIFAHTVLALLDKAKVDKQDIIAIGSHGQTIRHRPEQQYPFTLQIGDPNTISEITGIQTTADFRRRDLAAGGQGAPLAPAFHQDAFTSESEKRCIVNIGGMANISVLDTDPQKTLGYDTGPGNVLMDAWIERCHGKNYDKDGAWARSGVVVETVLDQLMAHPYIQKPYPKSTGREDFHIAWLLKQLSPEIPPENVQATLCEFTALSIAKAVKGHDTEAVYICGGGAHNDFLAERLKCALPHHKVSTTAELGIQPDWVETGLMAWLARQTLAHIPGNLPSVTGARHAAILGAIYPA